MADGKRPRPAIKTHGPEHHHRLRERSLRLERHNEQLRRLYASPRRQDSDCLLHTRAARGLTQITHSVRQTPSLPRARHCGRQGARTLRERVAPPRRRGRPGESTSPARCPSSQPVGPAAEGRGGRLPLAAHRTAPHRQEGPAPSFPRLTNDLHFAGNNAMPLPFSSSSHRVPFHRDGARR